MHNSRFIQAENSSNFVRLMRRIRTLPQTLPTCQTECRRRRRRQCGGSSAWECRSWSRCGSTWGWTPETTWAAGWGCPHPAPAPPAWPWTSRTTWSGPGWPGTSWTRTCGRCRSRPSRRRRRSRAAGRWPPWQRWPSWRGCTLSSWSLSCRQCCGRSRKPGWGPASSSPCQTWPRTTGLPSRGQSPPDLPPLSGAMSGTR